MQKSIISDLRRQLRENADEKTRQSSQHFYKEKAKHYGVRAAQANRIGREVYTQIKDKPKKEIFALCEELFKSDYSEEAWIAADWAYRLHSKFQPEDFHIFASWIEKYINNWAKCDTLCNHALGAFIEKYPRFIRNLKTWTASENRWVRRASAVSLILPARKGLFLSEIFQIADKLLLDQDDMVQKGYGWMLKEASKAHQQKVFKYVMAHKKVMPRTALRYAIEKMPASLRQKAMAK